MFRIVDVEVTQCIQYFRSPVPVGANSAPPDNSVPLVARRRTVLRVHIADAPAGSRASALARLRTAVSLANQTFQVTQLARNAVPAGTTADRADATTTSQIVLEDPAPGQHSIQLQALAFTPGGPTQVSAPYPLTLDFQPRNPLKLRLVRIHYKGRGLDVAPPATAAILGALDRARKLLPLPAPAFQVVLDTVALYDGDFTRIDPSAHDATWPGHAANRGSTGSLLNILDGLANTERLDPSVIYLGIYPAGANQSQFAGWAVGRWIISELDGDALAHEIGHKLCLSHAPCGNPAAPDPAFPSYPGLPLASIGDVGLDTWTLKTLAPGTHLDLMSYCGPSWISAYHYRRAFGCLGAPALPKPLPPPGQFSDPSVPIVVVKFPDRWTRVPLPLLPQGLPWFWPPRLQLDHAGPNEAARARLLGADGEVLAEAVGEAGAAGSEAEDAVARLEFMLPWREKAASLEVLWQGEPVWREPVRGPAPALNVTWPGLAALQGGRGWLHWSCDDDVEHLLLRCSADGGASWAVQLLRPADGEALIDIEAWWLGGTRLLELVAARGFRATRCACAPIDWPTRREPLRVLSPEDGERVEVDAGLRLDACPADPTSVITWASDRDGTLGTGALLFVDTLRPGRHLIEARSSAAFEMPTYRRITVARRRKTTRGAAKGT